MRAVAYRSYGGPDVLEVIDLPQPVPSEGQLLLKVHASSVNPIDWKKASGKPRLLYPAQFPHVPGYDVAGEVVALGANVSSFRVGDRVHARIDVKAGGGCAEYCLAGVNVSARIPDQCSYEDAAALPLAGMTALQGLRDRAELPMQNANARVLIVGASGGVGHLAVQIARSAGAHVVGVCSGRNTALVSSLGANETIDYTKDDPYKNQEPFDVVLDCVGGSPAKWLPLLKPGGHFASCMPEPSVFLYQFTNVLRNRTVRAVMLEPNAPDLRALDRLIEQKQLRVVIDKRFSLEQVREAWQHSISGRTAGKIVINVLPS